MISNKKATKFSIILALFIFTIFTASFVSASTDTLDVRMTEYISEVIAYDQTLGEESVQTDSRLEIGENRTGTSRTGHALHDFLIYGEINITNVETIGDTTLNSINVTFNGTSNMTSIQLKTAPAGGYLVYNISDLTPQASGLDNISIFIAELRAGDSVIFNFTISTYGKGEPLNFTENFTSWRMMTGNSTQVTLNATNSFPTDVLLYDLEVVKTPACYASVGGATSCFRFTDLSGEDQYNATIDSSSGKTLIDWNISGRDLSQYETRQIRFNAWAPENLTIFWNESADWATWMNMGNLSATFKFNGSMSGLELINVTAVAPYARVSVSKDRYNETHWNATFNITNDAPAPVDYNLTTISIWATKYQDYSNPGDTSTWVSNTNVSAYGFADMLGPYANATWFPRINLSAGGYNDTYSILFNYSLVPIIWSSTNFMILDDGTQIFRLNQSQSLEDGYLFIEEIYVLLGGYLVKATKTITPYEVATSNNTYIINVTIENVGREKTPEWVSMFDLIPADFYPLIWSNDNFAVNRSMTDENELTVTDFDGAWTTIASSNTVLGYSDTGAIPSGPYKNYWGYHIDFNGLNATSDGNGRFTAGAGDKEVGIRYKIAGNRSISRIENAYIIGVDPIRLEGANPSRSVASRLAATSTTMEYVVLIGSLLASVTILSVGFGFFKKK